MSSPSASAAVAGDNTAEGGVATTPAGESALAAGVLASRVSPYAPAANREVARKRFMVPLLISWDAPSLGRPAEATIRATTQSGEQPPGGNHAEAAYRSPSLNA